MLIFGQAIALIREVRQFTPEALSERLGIDTERLADLERDRTQPGEELIEKLSDVAGIDLHVLAWVRFGNTGNLPQRLRLPAIRLQESWARDVDAWEASRGT